MVFRRTQVYITIKGKNMITKAITFTILSLFISGCVGTMKIAEEESKKDLTSKNIITKNAKPKKIEEVKKEVKKNRVKDKEKK